MFFDTNTYFCRNSTRLNMHFFQRAFPRPAISVALRAQFFRTDPSFLLQKIVT